MSAKDQLKSELSKSGSIAGLTPTTVDAGTDMMAAIMLSVVEIGKKQDAQRLILDQQNTVLEDHGTKLDAGQVKMSALQTTSDTINVTTTETNGKVKKLRAEMDVLQTTDLPKLKILDKERTERVVEEERARLTKENLLVLPKKLGKILILIGQWLDKSSTWLLRIAAVGYAFYILVEKHSITGLFGN